MDVWTRKEAEATMLVVEDAMLAEGRNRRAGNGLLRKIEAGDRGRNMKERDQRIGRGKELESSHFWSNKKREKLTKL